jgi:hypothetical protein
MARQFTSGFEVASFTEWSASGGAVSIQSTTKRSGNNAMRVNGLTSATESSVVAQMDSVDATGDFRLRTYARFTTFPSAETSIIVMGPEGRGDTSRHRIWATIDASGVLRAYASTLTGNVQISGTTTLSTGNWYRIGLRMSNSPSAGSQIGELLVDGSTIATSSTLSYSAGFRGIVLGGNLRVETVTGGDWYFDDVALNDATGSFQTGWPGDGNVVTLFPSGVGDNTQWTRGGSDSGANWSQVDDNPPNGITDYVTSNTLGQIDDYALTDTPTEIGSSATINCVQLLTYFAGAAGTDTNAAFVTRIKASASGTVEELAEINPQDATWRTGSRGGLRQFSGMTLYDQPGASTTAWTKATLDTAQIGVRLSTIDTNAAYLSAIWLTVDYTAGLTAVPISRDVRWRVRSTSAQDALPVSDISNAGSWTRSDTGATTGLYTVLDDAIEPGSSDYVQSPADPTSAVFEVKVANISDPGSSTGHYVHFEYGKDVAGGTTVNLKVDLVQGTTIITTQQLNNIPAGWNEGVIALSGAECDAITDYTALRLRFTASSG